MGYFRELPNLLYPSFLPEKTSSLDYIEVKNVFRRVKVRDDLYNNFVVFQKYEIPEGARPDTVAEGRRGEPERRLFLCASRLGWKIMRHRAIYPVQYTRYFPSQDIEADSKIHSVFQLHFTWTPPPFLSHTYMHTYVPLYM